MDIFNFRKLFDLLAHTNRENQRKKATIQIKRVGNPEEVAKANLWLLSDEVSYSTGSFIDVPGG